MKTSFQKFTASNAVVGSTNVELGAVKVDLALFDDIAKGREKISKMIGFVNKDMSEVKKAFSLIEKIKVSKEHCKDNTKMHHRRTEGKEEKTCNNK